MLAAVFNPAHRMAAMHCQPSEADLFGEQDPFVTEAATNVGRDDANLALVEPEALGKSGANNMRHLTGGIEGELFQARIPQRDHAATLDWRHALARGTNFARHLDRGVERCGDIHFDEGFEKNVIAPVLVD